MLFNFSNARSSSSEILSSDLTLNIHLTMLSSFLSSLIWSSSLTGQVSLPYSTRLRTHAEYNLPFAPKDKPLLANIETKSLNLNHPLLILVITLSNAPPLAPIVSPRQQNFSTISRNWSFNSMLGKSSGMSVCWFTHVWHLPLTPHYLLCMQQLQNWHRMELMPKHFLQTAKGNLPSIVTNIFTTNHHYIIICLPSIYS